MLYSAGKDSSVLLHLARKAFHPAPPPFPLLHVDTMWKFRAMYALRDKAAAEAGMELIVHRNPEAEARGDQPDRSRLGASHPDVEDRRPPSRRSTRTASTSRSAAPGATRRRVRAKERIFSFRSAGHRWDPKRQRPELWRLYNGRKAKGEGFRVFPLSNWTELDVWNYVDEERIEVAALYFAEHAADDPPRRPILMVDDERLKPLPGEQVVERKVRFRTLGCYPLSGAVESEATDIAAILAEMRAGRQSERQGRLIDRDGAAAMERKKKEGYF